jgi:hypothetical protein
LRLNRSHPLSAVAPRRSDPQGIDNLQSAAGRGIMRHGSASIHEVGRQIPAQQPGRMACRWARHLLRAVPQREMRSADGRCPSRHPALRSALVGRRLAPCMQGLRLRWIGEHHSELARYAEPKPAILIAMGNQRGRQLRQPFKLSIWLAKSGSAGTLAFSAPLAFSKSLVRTSTRKPRTLRRPLERQVFPSLRYAGFNHRCRQLRAG